MNAQATSLRVFSAILLVTVIGWQSAHADQPESATRIRPNIVFILADDMGYGEVHALNPRRSKIPTPNLDKLVADGMVFTDAHTASSVCTPSRYALLTGRYCWRTRLQKGVLTGNDDPLIAADRPTVQGMLQDQGYHTAVIGKWHLNYNYEGEHKRNKAAKDPRGANFKPALAPVGTRIPDGPVTRGFDYYFGFHHAREMSSLCENDRIIEEIDVVEMLPRITSKAVEYIDQQAVAAKSGKPFFLYLPLSSPHTPIVPSKEWIGKSGLGEYGDFVMQTDGTVGEVVRAIDAQGLTDNTLLVFSCDNGTSKAAGIDKLQKQGHFPSAHLRGSKADIWDGGHRVPFIVRWPDGGVKAGSATDHLVCLSDLFATTAEMLGASIPESAAEDSFSFYSVLRGTPVSDPRQAIIHHSISGHFAIRKDNWKMCLARASGGWSSPNEKEASKQGLPDVQLYDMDADVGETNNLQAVQAERTRQLLSLLEQYVARGRSTPGSSQSNDADINLWKSK
jgi:arylsulfatase A